MSEIEKVNGIIVYEDGIPHPFGINKIVTTGEYTDENYHDSSFQQEVYSSKWFQETRYPYQLDKTIHAQISGLCSKGFTVILNGSSLTARREENNIYSIQTPINITDNTKEYLSSIYEELKELIEQKNALFFGEPYNEEGELVWRDAAYNIDDFYDKMEIPKKIGKHK